MRRTLTVGLMMVGYIGKPQESWRPCHWKVRVWDKQGMASVWSQPAAWTMGLLESNAWQAKWIGAGTMAHESLLTDEQWRVHSAPVTFNCACDGEDYDARLCQSGWDQPGFSDATWEPAVVTQGPGGALKGLSCAAPPVRGFDTLKPVKTTATVYVPAKDPAGVTESGKPAAAYAVGSGCYRFCCGK